MEELKFRIAIGASYPGCHVSVTLYHKKSNEASLSKKLLLAGFIPSLSYHHFSNEQYKFIHYFTFDLSFSNTRDKFK